MLFEVNEIVLELLNATYCWRFYHSLEKGFAELSQSLINGRILFLKSSLFLKLITRVNLIRNQMPSKSQFIQ